MKNFKVQLQYGDKLFEYFLTGDTVRYTFVQAVILVVQEAYFKGYSLNPYQPTKVIVKVGN